MRQRLDQYLFENGLAQSRSQAENLVKLGKVKVDGLVATKPHQNVFPSSTVEVFEEKYVSRAGNKLASVAQKLNLDFKDKVVLDIGSSTGGFTEYALRNKAKKVIAVDVGTDQLHRSLLGNKRIDLHEKTDIRNVLSKAKTEKRKVKDEIQIEIPSIVLMDLSFISLRDVLPHVATLCSRETQIVAMVKPQFEAGEKQKNKGVVKNDKVRREILKDFELWTRQHFIILDKADSEVAGTKGNLERFYLLKLTK